MEAWTGIEAECTSNGVLVGVAVAAFHQETARRRTNEVGWLGRPVSPLNLHGNKQGIKQALLAMVRRLEQLAQRRRRLEQKIGR